MENYESFEEGKRQTKNSRQAIPEGIDSDTTISEEDTKFNLDLGKAIQESFIDTVSSDNNKGSSLEGSSNNNQQAPSIMTGTPDLKTGLKLALANTIESKDLEKHIAEALKAAWIYDVETFSWMAMEDLKKLKRKASSVEVDLTKSKIMWVERLRTYINEKLREGHDINSASLYDQTKFNKWKYEQQKNAVAIPTIIPGKRPVLTSTPEKDKLIEFRRHKRIDLANYPIIDHDHKFSQAMLNVIKLATFDKFEQVFDLDTFDPTKMTDPDDKTLYKEQKYYAMIIMTKMFQSSSGKDCVRNNPTDACKLYKDYFEHIQRSPSTNQHHHTELTSMLATPLSLHKGLTKTYVLSMEKLFQNYNDNNLVKIPDSLMITYMQQAVCSHNELNNVWKTLYATKQSTTLPGTATTITYEEYKQDLKDQADLVDVESKKAQGALNSEFRRSLNVNIAPTTKINQAILDESIPHPDRDNYPDKTELLGHDLESGELRAFKVAKGRRRPMKLKTFVERSIFGDNEGFFREWVNAKEEVRQGVLDRLLQQHAVQKNSNLKVVAAATVRHSEPSPVVTNNYYGQFSEAMQYSEDIPPSSNTV